MSSAERDHSGAMCELAALYAAGALDAREASGFEQHLGDCEACGREVGEMRETASALTLLVAEPPPPSVKERLFSRISSVRAGILVRRDEGEWKRPLEGIEVKHLYSDPVTGAVAQLLRAQPGAKYPRHAHAGTEHTYVLEGDCVFEDHTLYAGDYEVAEASSVHSSITTKTGCLLLLINNSHDRVLR